MLSYKQWKQVNESLDFSLGLATPASVGMTTNFQDLLDEAKKKMKKKMFGDEEEVVDDSEDEEEDEDLDVEEPEEDAPEEDAETGDGEVVDPASKKDVPPEEEEEGGNPLLARLKKMKGNMKKKMCADDKKDKKDKKEKVKKEDADNDWMKSVFFAPPANKNFDGIGVTEDALLPVIDPNTGLYDAAREPQPGQVGFAPQGVLGRNF